MPRYLSMDPGAGQYLSTDPTEGQSVQTPTYRQEVIGELPPTTGANIGGLVGGLAAGAPGAIVGGTAGYGYEQLLKHAQELPAALQDVLRLAIEQPKATAQGFLEGATSGAQQASIQGVEQGALEGAGALAAKGLSAAGKAVYRGYLKPSLAIKSLGKADEIVQTALNEALPVTKGGSAHAQQVIGELKDQVDTILQQSQGTVDLHQIADKVRAFAKATYFRAGVPEADFNIAMKVADNLDAHPALVQGAKLVTGVAAPVANEVKQGIQNSVRNSYGVMSGAEKTTRKVAGSYVRDALETVAPAIAPLNARESKLIDAAKAINRAVGREANQSQTYGMKALTSVGLPLMGGAVVGGGTYRQTQDPYMAAVTGLLTTLGTRVAISPGVASRAAIVAAKLGKQGGMLPATAARVALAAVMDSQQ